MRIWLLKNIFPFIILFTLFSCKENITFIEENDFESAEFADFVENNFPFINTSLNNNGLGSPFPEDNQVPRALCIQLGNDAYVGFDTDLLRWSVAWRGDFVSMTTVAQVSYHIFFSKEDRFPTILGNPEIATGTYPGWTNYRPDFKDPRKNQNQNDGRNWGPLPNTIGRWNGNYTYNDKTILHYTIQETEIYELPSSVAFGDEVAFTRSLKTASISDTLYSVIAEFTEIESSELVDNIAYFHHKGEADSITAIGLTKEQKDDSYFYIHEHRYLVLVLPPTSKTLEKTILLWKGESGNKSTFINQLHQLKVVFPKYKKGGTPYWTEKVYTKGKIAPDTSAYVLDQLMLPVPNPWKRNVRVADIAFYEDGKAAIVTFDGDVWLLSGINQKLDKLVWTRYASGLFGPMSIGIRDGSLFVFGREGITKLHDFNNDGVADYYENFSPLIIQSMESREWPTDMAIDDDGYFYIAKGGGTILNNTTAKDSPEAGYNAASSQAGSVLKISPDGNEIEQYATGFRLPYIGLHPKKKIVSVSDQQGNFVPATPIYIANKGDYFGVISAAHSEDPLSKQMKRPLTWIPHHVDRSSISQLWVTSSKMGPLNQSMLHYSFGRPGLFTVLMDTIAKVKQGGVSYIMADYPAPVLKGAVHPKDGFVYSTGFNLWGSNSMGISALTRLRYTGKSYHLPVGFRAGKQGIILTFSEKLEKENIEDIGNYAVKRWNYKRTPKYGSGHYLLNGEPGEEKLPVLESHLSQDGKSVFIVLPNMEEVMQMQLIYKIKTIGGKTLENQFNFSINDASPINLKTSGFEDVHLKLADLELSSEKLASLTVEISELSAEKGALLFKNLACIGCHSTGNRTDGMYGTPFKNLYKSTRFFKDGSSAIADEAYIKESIVNPNKKIVKGYGDEMPSFSGLLTDDDIQSLILYIKTL